RIKNKATAVFDKVKSVLLSPFITARDKIRDVIDTIKGYLDFKWSFPKLKMPHFKISNGSLNPLDWIKNGVPKLSVEWYAKGGIFSKPTIFNTPYGLKGVGDAKSPEVVAPLHELKAMLGLNDNKSEEILYYLRLIADKDNRVFLDGREITRGIYDYIEETIIRNSTDYRLATGGI
ncbi:MAG: hypothetical protein K0M69_10330, partial [Youngiibacter sp.]|nr:hypothetical protein [Youngiibacter sp.]